MTGELLDKTAFVTGAARGLGRSIAIALARAGANIVAIDICASVSSVPYPSATPEDLAQTVAEVEELGRRIVALKADVRDEQSVRSALQTGIDQLGPIDIVVANAGIAPISLDERPTAWQDSLDVNLTGVFNTVESAIGAMAQRGTGGSIVIMSSTAGAVGNLGPTRGALGYTAAKHGAIGLMRAYANNLAPHGIRVNAILPTGIDTPMGRSDGLAAVLEQHTRAPGVSPHALSVDLVETADISNAVLWLVSDAARYVTGVSLPVDAGFLNKS